jgi:hypothetical protein
MSSTVYQRKAIKVSKVSASTHHGSAATLGAPAETPAVALTTGLFGKHLVLAVQHFVFQSVTATLLFAVSLNLVAPQVTVAPAHTVLSSSQHDVTSAVPQVAVAQYRS